MQDRCDPGVTDGVKMRGEDQRHARDGGGHHRRHRMEAVRVDDVKQLSVSPQRTSEPRRDRKLTGASPIGKPLYLVVAQRRKRGATGSLCVDHHVMALPLQLVGQVSDNHFDATELWREPWGHERDPHWSVRWQAVAVRLELLLHQVGCCFPITRTGTRGGTFW